MALGYHVCNGADQFVEEFFFHVLEADIDNRCLESF